MRRSSKKFIFLRFIYLFGFYICVCFQHDAFVREHVWHKALLMGCSMRLELTQIEENRKINVPKHLYQCSRGKSKIMPIYPTNDYLQLQIKEKKFIDKVE